MKVDETAQPVADWIWRGDHPGSLPDAGLSPGSGDGETWTGQFATHQERPDGQHLLSRDRLGINKLFFAVDQDGGVHSSNFLIDLRGQGFPLAEIYSVPSGHSIHMSPEHGDYRIESHSSLRYGKGDLDPDRGLTEYADEIRSALERIFLRLSEALRGRRVFVTLSGGLDSTTIAALAARHLENVTAVTFELAGESDPDATAASSDLASARRVAEFLELPHEVVRISPDQLLDLLDPVLVWGQDWRDFNVHCGLVNAALARGLSERGFVPSGTEPRPVFLTGDTMNELMADYHAESYGGREHYALPRLGWARLRRSLIEGLDSGDREVGLFRHYGFDAIQPYALCADAYAALPAEALASEQIKQDLVREVMGDAIPAHVYCRPKVRAQVANADGVGGTLAALVDRGVNSDKLAQRFADLMGENVRELSGLIRAGFYRISATLPEPTSRLVPFEYREERAS